MFFQNTHIVVGALVIISIFVLYYMFFNKSKKTDGFENFEEDKKATGINDVNDLIDNLNAQETQQHPVVAEEQPVDNETKDKLKWKNEATGKYVSSSYKDGSRGNDNVDEWNQYFETNTDVMDKGYIQNNDKFAPVDETRGNLASYGGGDKKKYTPEELFKVDKLLPQEVPKDWFEVMPEPIKVKNRHLINVTRPVGINTIGTSLKNPSYDIRGCPAAPKFVVSPWLQSSYEPDLNIKGLN